MLSKKDQKLIKSLKIKKYRTREKRFLIEGTKNVLELLHSDFSIDFLVGTQRFLDAHAFIADSHRFEVVKADLLTQLGTFKTNDAVLAVAWMKEEVQPPTREQGRVFVLDGVSDPGNLGTIIRTLDWFGFDKVICSRDAADFYNPKVIASTMGSFVRVSVIYSELESYLDRFGSVPIYATAMDGAPLETVDFEESCFVVMGSESHGVSDAVLKRSRHRVAIPRVGVQAESLNVGVATGIIASYLRMSRK